MGQHYLYILAVTFFKSRIDRPPQWGYMTVCGELIIPKQFDTSDY